MLPRTIEAARAGFDAVVFDLSALPFEQNMRPNKEAVEALKGINPDILIESEIGHIGTGSEMHIQAHCSVGELTTADEARQSVNSTGVHILAPAVGNMHGMLQSMIEGEIRKHLDLERIPQIKCATGIPLTLHGGSGTDSNDLRKSNSRRDQYRPYQHRAANCLEAGACRMVLTSFLTKSFPTRYYQLPYSL
jgi:fructose-bisphosphate aldolase class II